MIPLSNWLSAEARAGGHATLAQVSIPCSCSADQERIRAAEIEEALLRGRLEGAEAAKHEWEGKLAAVQDAQAAALAAMRAQSDERFSAAIAEGISEAVSALRMNIENAVANVLRPFLRDRVTQAALAELLRLIEADLQQHASPALEIRAPAELHEALRSMLAKKSMACVLTESEDVRLISAHASLRYESLAESWIAALEGSGA